jgi:hypothetical protein
MQLMGSCTCVYELNGLDLDDPDSYPDGPTDEMYAVFEAEVDKYGGRLPWRAPGARCLPRWNKSTRRWEGL